MAARFFFACVVAMVLGTTAIANYFDTGVTTFNQGPPYTTTFQGRYWGDEFAWSMETDDGYAIIYNPYDRYYYSDF